MTDENPYESPRAASEYWPIAVNISAMIVLVLVTIPSVAIAFCGTCTANGFGTYYLSDRFGASYEGFLAFFLILVFAPAVIASMGVAYGSYHLSRCFVYQSIEEENRISRTKQSMNRRFSRSEILMLGIAIILPAVLGFWLGCFGCGIVVYLILNALESLVSKPFGYDSLAWAAWSGGLVGIVVEVISVRKLIRETIDELKNRLNQPPEERSAEENRFES